MCSVEEHRTSKQRARTSRVVVLPSLLSSKKPNRGYQHHANIRVPLSLCWHIIPQCAKNIESHQESVNINVTINCPPCSNISSQQKGKTIRKLDYSPNNNPYSLYFSRVYSSSRNHYKVTPLRYDGRYQTQEESLFNINTSQQRNPLSTSETAS